MKDISRDVEVVQVNKTLSLFGVVLDNVSPRSAQLADVFFRVLLDNANTGYDEVRRRMLLSSSAITYSPLQMRNHIATSLYQIISAQWAPTYSTVAELLHACVTDPDPLKIRQVTFLVGSGRRLTCSMLQTDRLVTWRTRLPRSKGCLGGRNNDCPRHVRISPSTIRLA